MRKLTFGGVCFRHSLCYFLRFAFIHTFRTFHTLYTRFVHVLKMPITPRRYWLYTLHTFIFYILYIYRYPHKDIRGYRGIYIKGIERFFACKRVNPCCYWLYGIFYACGKRVILGG